MNIQVSLEEKKSFIGWFLDRHQLKRRESMWILNYLLNHDIVLNKVHFVEDVETTPRGIMMSTVGMDNEPFLFYKDGKSFSDPEQAFHEVRLNWHEDMYLELVFREPWKTEEYLAILEDNPYHRWNDTIPKDVKKDAEHAIIHLNLSEKKQVMLKLIDEALESGNRQEFIEFSTKLKEIDKELLNQQKKTNL